MQNQRHRIDRAARRATSAFVIAAALAAPAAAHAQGASSQAAAQALFDEGKHLMAAGQLADACSRFAESQKLDPGAGTLLNLAACYEKNGQTASAWVSYKDAATSAEKSSRADWATRARTKAAALQPSLSKLSIIVPSTSQADGLTLKRDGVEVGSGEWGVAIPVDPGPHVIEASAPSKQPWTTTVQVGKARDQVAVTVPPLEAAAPAPAPVAAAPVNTTPAPASDATPPKSGSNATRIGGISLLAAGAGGLVIGTVFGLGAKSKHDDAKAQCNADQSVCTAAGTASMSDAHKAATISTIAFAAGGVALVAGAILTIVAPGSEAKGRKVGKLEEVRVDVSGGPGGAGVILGGAF